MRKWPLKWKIIAAVAFLVVAAPLMLATKEFAIAMAILDEKPSRKILPRPNAFDEFEAAIMRIVREKEIGKVLPPLFYNKIKNKAHQWTVKEKESLIHANQTAMTQAREGLKHPFVEPDADPSNYHYRLIKARDLAKLLALEGEARLARGDPSGSARCDLDAVEMGAKIESADTYVGMLVGIACQSVGRNRLRFSLDRLDADSARSDARVMESANEAISALPDIFTGEERFVFSSFRYYYQHPEHYADEIEKGMSENPDSIHNKKFSASVNFLMRIAILHHLLSYANYMDALIKGMTLPYKRRPPAPPLPLNPIAQLALPYFDIAPIRYADNGVQNALLATDLALRAYRKERRSYPENLKALTPRYLHHLPADPFNDGAPLGYRKLGAKYLLYSVGPDGRDDGGRPVENPKDEGEREQAHASRYGIRKESRGDIVAGINIY